MMTNGAVSSSTNGSAGASNGTSSADTSSTDSASSDTGTDSSSATDTGESAEGSAAASTSTSTPDVPKYKFRRLGRDHELTADELAKMLDDDYEHDFHGAGGKPLLQDGKPLKMRWRDIVRAVQMSKGATDAMRQHNEARQRLEQQLEWAKQPENTPVFFEEHMGIESFDDWVLERAGDIVTRQEQLLELAKRDPYKHQQELAKLAEARFQRRQQAKERQQQAEMQRKQRAEYEQQHWHRVGEALGKVGLKLNERTRAIADNICREFAEAKAELSWEQLAEYVRDAYHEDIFGYLDSHDDDKLLNLLGNSRRERLRQAELAALKGKKAEQKKSEPKPAPKPSSGDKREPRGLTAEEFLRSGRNGGRV